MLLTYAGRGGLAVVCLTALREVLESNRTVGSCVYCKNHCVIQAVSFTAWGTGCAHPSCNG